MTATIQHQLRATAVSEGAGVTVHRTIGTHGVRHLDPFLMLDHFGSNDPDEYIAGFPDHPHRGFITLTYMLDGHMQHRDSMGNRGELRAGGIQWMKAASGVIHSEMPQQANGLMRGFQLWINLPSQEKMSDPEYQEFAADQIPAVAVAGARVKMISGELNGVRGPIHDPHTQLEYLDVEIAPARSFARELRAGRTAFIYLFEGNARIAGRDLDTHTFVALSAGTVDIVAGAQGARFIFVSGKPLQEPIFQHGPFVMNTAQEVRQAFEDYQSGRLVKVRAAVRA